MEKNIDYEFTERPEIAYMLLTLAKVVCCVFPFFFIASLASASGIMFFIVIILELISLAAVIILKSVKNVVNADKKKLTVKKFVCGKLVSTESFECADIESADCFVKHHMYKGNTRYTMEAVISFINGKKLKFTKELKIRVNMHKRDPQQFDRLVAAEPMLQLCEFVSVNMMRR